MVFRTRQRGADSGHGDFGYHNGNRTAADIHRNIDVLCRFDYRFPAHVTGRAYGSGRRYSGNRRTCPDNSRADCGISCCVYLSMEHKRGLPQCSYRHMGVHSSVLHGYCRKYCGYLYERQRFPVWYLGEYQG